jgi:uncharacterized protein (TIGR02453 family)
MGATTRIFNGFPREAFAFLAGLAGNNTKAWFNAHRDAYDKSIVAPALAFTDAMGARLKAIAPSLEPEPWVGGSLFRINRDVRFAVDKSPYKTHVGIRLRDGGLIRSSKCTGPLFYVEFDAAHLRLGVGIKEFDKQTLESFRSAVVGKGAVEVVKAIRWAESRGHKILGERLTRVPAAYATQPSNELLKCKGVFIRHEMLVPPEIHGPEFVRYCGRWFKQYGPLFQALRQIAVQGLV